MIGKAIHRLNEWWNGSQQTVAATPLQPQRRINATYDAAQHSEEYGRYWASADHYDADSANSYDVRRTLVSRSRYEMGNNGYTDGMGMTHADYLVGVGPKLRMQSGSETFNSLVERQWMLWTKAVHFRRKLWAQAHAKGQDGEGFGYVATNPGINHAVQMDYKIFETEICRTPFLPFGDPQRLDGIWLDEWDNILFYELLLQHPGRRELTESTTETELVPARFVQHWYNLRRPGQHRAVPENTSTLNCGGASRRFREATLATAETVAEMNVLLKTNLPPNTATMTYQPVPAMSSIPLERNMLVTLPAGYDAEQMDAKHPNAQYKDFLRSQINEQGRPRAMPVNVAMGDSSDHNFASGKLDHMPWHQRMRVEREDCNDLVLDPVFSLWFEELALQLGFRSRNMPRHTWDWPELPVADEKARASANNMNLQNGSKTLSELYSEKGQDFEEDVLPKMAQDYGVSVDEMRQILLTRNLGGLTTQAQITPPLSARITPDQITEIITDHVRELIDAGFKTGT